MSDIACLYDCRTKVIAANPEVAKGAAQAVPDAAIYTVTATDSVIELLAPSGRTLDMAAPACGAVALVGPKRDPGLKAVSMVWTRAGLPAPKIIDSAASGMGQRLMTALILLLEQELTTTARQAVTLDTQVAFLRDTLEDARTSVAEAQGQLRALGQTPIEVLSCAPTGPRLPLNDTTHIRQPLPFSGHMIGAVGIAFDPATLAHLDSSLVEATLIAREDGTTLGHWVIRQADVDDVAGGQAVLALDAPIPRKYRYLDLDISASGSGPAPALLLGSDRGDSTMTLSEGGAPRAGEMLALRLWSGPVFSRDARNDKLLFPLGDDSASRYRIPLPAAPFKQARLLSQPVEDIKWYRQSGRDIFCHPVASTPNVVALPLALSTPFSGISTRLDLANAQAFPTQFAILCAPGDHDVETVLAQLDSPKDVIADTLAVQPWVELLGGTTRAVELTFDHPVDYMTLYLATRVAGDRMDFAHAWFRDLSVLQPGVVHAQAA